jgi:hypothetical protein
MEGGILGGGWGKKCVSWATKRVCVWGGRGGVKTPNKIKVEVKYLARLIHYGPQTSQAVCASQNGQGTC